MLACCVEVLDFGVEVGVAANFLRTRTPPKFALARLGSHFRVPILNSACELLEQAIAHPNHGISRSHSTENTPVDIGILHDLLSGANNDGIAQPRHQQCPRTSRTVWTSHIPRPERQGPIDHIHTTQYPSESRTKALTTCPRRCRLITHHTHNSPTTPPPPNTTRTLHNRTSPWPAVPAYERRHAAPAIQHGQCPTWRRPQIESRDAYRIERLYVKGA
jgi:hypothetical protein